MTSWTFRGISRARRRQAASLLILLAAACIRDEPERELRATPVRIETVKRAAFTPTLPLVGVVRASATVPLIAEKAGTLTLAPRFRGGLRTGERVRAGELIAEIENEQARSIAKQAHLEAQFRDAEHDRIKRSFELNIIPSSEYAAAQMQAKLAHERYRAALDEARRLRITAPRAGTLVVATPQPNGVLVTPGTKIADIASSGPSIIESAVPAGDRDQIHPGLNVRISHGGWTGEGRISEVASVIDASGTARVVIAVAPGSPAPPPGTGVDLLVALAARPDAITIPEEAIVAGSEGQAVFIVSARDAFGGGYRAKRAPVEIGGRSGGKIEIRSGLRDGDRVIVSGVDALSDNSLVSEAAEKK